MYFHIVFLFGKRLRSSPPHPPGNGEECGLSSGAQALGNNGACSSFLPCLLKKHRGTFWQCWGSSRWFEAEQLCVRLAGNEQSCLQPAALASVFSSSGLWDGWRSCIILLKQSPESNKQRNGACIKTGILHLNISGAFSLFLSQ